MFFSQAFIASALVSLPVASAAIIDVFVGGEGKLAFTPENVKANVGDSIRFTFGVKNHTVTQSTFDNPCQQMTDATGKPAGFFSGYMPVAAGQTTDLPQFWIPVRDTKPIWAFCQQGAHCQAGMVFAVNADDSSDKSFANYKAKATGAAAQPVATPATDAGTGAADPYGGAYGGGAGYGGGYGDGGAATPTPTATPVAATDAPASATASIDPATGSPLAGAAAGTGNVIKVTVGGSAGLVFTPNIIKANPGDVVQFEFQVKNHTVTQSTFGAPCTASPGGFDSGFQPVAAGATSFPTWSITINDTTPIWAYCKQANHCAQGMVLAINSDESSDKSFANFQAAAKGSAAGPSGSSGSGGAYGNAALSTKSMGAGVVLVGLVSAAFGLLL